ncbi:hypothetical protein BESB_007060 [Besnoitia besnoiti]|uniref:Uncharacterized protein n=1 Tax=Besnoitia besnoiti TaxID=94643 RepID=A0A2A9MK66_BESBE|nr:hypothetical protein BESB_007060 [Besnoitia besnoiti]PFH38365.1 hypothetical protein BESB_007060 [Besnoitia besnoiti]
MLCRKRYPAQGYPMEAALLVQQVSSRTHPTTTELRLRPQHQVCVGTLDSLLGVAPLPLSDRLKVVGYFALSPSSGVAAGDSAVELSLALCVFDCSRFALTLPLLLTAGPAAAFRARGAAGAPHQQRPSPAQAPDSRERAAALTSLQLRVTVNPPQLQLVSPPTLDYGVIRAHSQVTQLCRLKNRADVPTLARLRRIPEAPDLESSLDRSHNIPEFPVSRYSDLVRFACGEVGNAPGSAALGAASANTPGENGAVYHWGSPFNAETLERLGPATQRPPAESLRHRTASGPLRRSACARCSCVVDYAEETDADSLQVLAATTSEGPPGGPAARGQSEFGNWNAEAKFANLSSSRRPSGSHSVTFYPEWVLVPARGTADIAVILTTSHPKVLSGVVAVDWLGVDGGIILGIQAAVQLPRVRLSRTALHLDFCYIHIPRTIDEGGDAAVFLCNDSDLPASFSWHPVPVSAAEGDSAAACAFSKTDSRVVRASSVLAAADSAPLEIRFRPAAGLLAPRSRQAVHVEVVAHRVAPELQAAGACWISGLLSPLYFKVQTPCKSLQLKYALLDEATWKRCLSMEPPGSPQAGPAVGTGRAAFASRRTLGLESTRASVDALLRFRSPRVSLPPSLPHCDQLREAGAATPGLIEMTDGWEECSGRASVLDTIQVETLKVGESRIVYLLLSNVCSIPASFRVSAVRYPAAPSTPPAPEATPFHAETLQSGEAQAQQRRRAPSSGHALPAQRGASADRRALFAQLADARERPRAKSFSRGEAARVNRHQCLQSPRGTGPPFDLGDPQQTPVKDQSLAESSPLLSDRRALSRASCVAEPAFGEEGAECRLVLTRTAFRSAPGYLSASGQAHCAAAAEEKRRALLLSDGMGFAVFAAPAVGCLPANATECIPIEFLADAPGTFEDRLVLELRAHPCGGSPPGGAASPRSPQQNLRMQAHFPLRVSAVGEALLFAPHQPSLSLAAAPCPRIAIASCIVPSRAYSSRSAPAKPGWLPVQSAPAAKVVLPLNALAAAAAEAAVSRAQGERPASQQLDGDARAAERPLERSASVPRGETLAGESKGACAATAPPSAIFKVFNRSPEDVFLEWRIFDLDAWDEQRREEGLRRETAEREALAAREAAEKESEDAEAERLLELERETQRQQDEAPAPAPAPTPSSPSKTPGNRREAPSQTSSAGAPTPTGAPGTVPSATVPLSASAPQGSRETPETGVTARCLVDEANREDDAEGSGAQPDEKRHMGVSVGDAHTEEAQEGRSQDEAGDGRGRGPMGGSAGEASAARRDETLVPPDTCALENLPSSREASSRLEQGGGKDIPPKRPVVVSPGLCIIKAKSTQTFRITFEGLHETARQHRFRLVGTGTQVPKTSGPQSPPISGARARPLAPAGRTGATASCGDRPARDFRERSAHAELAASSEPTSRRAATAQSKPEKEVAALPSGEPGDSSDEEMRGTGHSATSRGVETDGPSPSGGRCLSGWMEKPESDNINRGEESDEALRSAGRAAHTRGPANEDEHGDELRIRERAGINSANRVGGQGASDSVLLLDVHADFYEPQVDVGLAQDLLPGENEESSSKTHDATGTPSGAGEPLCTFAATPSSWIEGRDENDAERSRKFPCNSESTRLEILQHTIYLRNPLPCDVHVAFAVEGDHFSIKGIKLDKDSSGTKPCRPGARQAFVLRPGQRGRLQLAFRPPPLSLWRAGPLTEFRGFLVASFPSAPVGTRRQRWEVTAECRQPAIRLESAERHAAESPVDGEDDLMTRAGVRLSGGQIRLHVAFGRVHIAARKAVKRSLTLSSVSPVAAKWSLAHVPKESSSPTSPSRSASVGGAAHRRTRLGTSSRVPISRSVKKATDDPNAFRFDIRSGVLGPGAERAIGRSRRALSATSCGVQKVSVVFEPRSVAVYRSRFRICVEHGESIDFELEGVGSVDEEDDP